MSSIVTLAPDFLMLKSTRIVDVAISHKSLRSTIDFSSEQSGRIVGLQQYSYFCRISLDYGSP